MNSITTSSTPDLTEQRSRIIDLEDEVAELRVQLNGQDPQAIIKRHIQLLHTYYEIKDGAQRLIGAYAAMTQTTITAVHEELGLSLTE